MDEEGRECIHGRVRLAIGEGARPAEAEQLTVRWIAQSRRLGLLLRPPPQQPVGRDRGAVLLGLGDCERAHGARFMS
ncbi:hypothetical protein AUC69_03390 [Methyloceanibacter superfactus]|uniref:Uncharacterized protein n=1 Tax=Methyloceanibacter superfactus TaxID=1774969 RepID=A0A1E3VL14_9HYPH|nr:hypothetical protein AUC69_03390 [Methyloceanibacter superfactus]